MIVGEMYSLNVSEATLSMYLVSRATLAGEAEADAAFASGDATISTISSNPGAGAIPSPSIRIMLPRIISRQGREIFPFLLDKVMTSISEALVVATYKERFSSSQSRSFSSAISLPRKDPTH